MPAECIYSLLSLIESNVLGLHYREENNGISYTNCFWWNKCFTIFIFDSIALHQFLDFLNWVWTNSLGITYPLLPVFSTFLLYICLSYTYTHNSALPSDIRNSLNNCLRLHQQFSYVSILGRRMSVRTKKRPLGWAICRVQGDSVRIYGRVFKEQNTHNHLKSRDHTFFMFHCTTPTLKSQMLVCFLNGSVNEQVGSRGSGYTISRR